MDQIDNKRYVDNIFNKYNFVLNSQWIYSPKEEGQFERVKEEILLRVFSILNKPVNLWEILREIESRGLEYEFDTRILRIIMEQLSKIQNNGWENKIFHLNLYPKTFINSYYSDEISRTINETKVKTNNIVFELLETWQKCEDFYSMNQEIKKLYEEFWIKTSIDDYWSWNNNKELLEKLKFYKIIKIDWFYIEESLKWGIDVFLQKISYICYFLKKQNVLLEEITFEGINSKEKLDIILKLKPIFEMIWVKMSFQWYYFDKPSLLK